MLMKEVKVMSEIIKLIQDVVFVIGIKKYRVNVEGATISSHLSLISLNIDLYEMIDSKIEHKLSQKIDLIFGVETFVNLSRAERIDRLEKEIIEHGKF